MRRAAALAALASLAAVVALPAAPAGAALSLTAPASGSFGTVTLNGADQTKTYTLSLTAGDTGPSAGWRLTVTSTLLSTAGPPAGSLPATASTITGVTVTCLSSCGTTPSNSVGYPVTVPADVAPPPAVRFRNATLGTGLGNWTVKPAVSVAVPANALKGSYSSTMTLAIVAGP